ncbi:Rab-like protein 6 [Orchesella cincta]|uniref:Rab-like protein 6 n=1 Tax=Orchesella cincta TaxID=48709 RepID=A0A1D2MTJ2_ORCCI|nr:Rab-like protein 6 [Orchesella cincta]
MFSAFKRMTGRGVAEGQQNGGNGTSSSTPPGLTAMSVSLQKRLVSKGVHYNMKIILKGDRNVGKTQMFRRLQGQPFIEEYTATEEIQVANIMWNYKTSDDIVKVEVWDVVDVANKKKRLVSDKLKIENSNSEAGMDNVPEYGLDANTIDVYKNTNGVIFVFDITKNWTFEYVKREIENVPEHIPILILGNRRDMGHHRAIAADTVTFFIENLERGGSGAVRYAESSMRNGFGLKFIHKFFNLPYLQLQRDALLKQLETNQSETEICYQELDLYVESDEANYDLFIDGLSQKRRQLADSLAPPKLSLAQAQALASERALKEAKEPEAAVVAAAKFAVNSDPSSNRPPVQLPKGVKVSGTSPVPNNVPSSSSSSPNQSTALKDVRNSNQQSRAGNITSVPTPRHGGRSGIDDFVPDTDEHINAFLADAAANPSGSSTTRLEFESSDDESSKRGNPLVVSIEEDFDEGILSTTSTRIIVPDSIVNAKDTSDDEEEILHQASPVPTENESKDIGANKLGFSLFVTDENAKNNSASSVEEEQPSSLDSGGKKSSKKSSRHKKSSSKTKHKKSSKKDNTHHHMDLEEFLSGDTSVQAVNVDSSAYEAL